MKYLLSNVTGTIDADPTSSTFTMTASATASNAFILKLNGSGTATFIKNHELATFKIYPNPSSQEITIELNFKNKISQITITNYLGEQIIKMDNIEIIFKININNLPAGIYQVSINSNNQIFSSKLVIVK